MVIRFRPTAALVIFTLIGSTPARADDKPAATPEASPPPADKKARSVTRDPDETPPEPGSSWSDPTEPAHKRQLYLGVRYRGVEMPKFLMNLFADEGRTVLLHSAGLELDVRRDGFSVTPYILYARYFMDDTLFLEKGKEPANPGSYSFINASLHAFYVGVDVLWSVKVNRYIDFEAGLGVGIAFVYGDLVNNWVYPDANGPFVSSSGLHLKGCDVRTDAPSCQKENHDNAKNDKVGRYVEPNWLNGGSVPSFYARIAAPLLGFRIKPARDWALRIQGGLSLTEGFLFGANLEFRLPTN